MAKNDQEQANEVSEPRARMRAGEAASEGASRGVRGAKPLGEEEEIFLKAMGHLAHTPGEGAASSVEPNLTAN